MGKVIKFLKKYKSSILNIICFIVIFIVAVFLRVYKLENIPSGVNVDEAGMAYDAFCLSKFMVDRALNKFPVYFINFGGGQSILYGYVTAIFIKLYGFNITSIRITAVIFNLIAILACFLMIRKHIGQKSALVVSFLLTINPWNIMSSRWGLDCNLLALCLIISLYFLLRAKKWYQYIFAGLAIGISLYTYAISYIIIPVFLILILSYMLYVKRITFKNIIILGIPIFILALPLMLMILVNNGILEQINWIFTIPKLPKYRGSEISISNIITNLKSLNKILIYDDLPFNSLPEYGTLYNFAIVLMVLGIFIEGHELIKNIKEKKFSINTVIFLMFISVSLCMMLIADINISKSNAIYFPLIFLCYSSLHYIYLLQHKKISKADKILEKIKILVIRLILIAILIMYCINFYSFTKFYFTRYEEVYEHQQFFEKDLIEIIDQVNGRDEFENRDIYIYTGAERPYIYTLYVNPISPYTFNETRDENDNYGRYKIIEDRIINENAVYIVRADSDFSYELAAYHGFCNEEMGIYILLYR